MLDVQVIVGRKPDGQLPKTTYWYHLFIAVYNSYFVDSKIVEVTVYGFCRLYIFPIRPAFHFGFPNKVELRIVATHELTILPLLPKCAPLHFRDLTGPMP